MKQRRLRELVALGGAVVAIPAVMSASVNADAVFSSVSAAASVEANGDGAVDEDNDVFAASHLASQFEMFSGSRQNAQNLVTGLHRGGKIRLNATDPKSLPASLMFTPATKPMSYGEISRALSLAQAQLANRGVINPTPEQLHIALMGGSFASGDKTVGTTGVLQLRSQGMGWGQIAHALSLSNDDSSFVAVDSRGLPVGNR